MYLDFGRTADGFIKVEAQAVASLVSRHLPRGVQCGAVRLRAHDRLCLVVINDTRDFWSRDDDMRRARAITDDLRSMGMDMPRLQWIRQNRASAGNATHFALPVYCYPCFWAAVGGSAAAFAFMPWAEFALCIAVSFFVWFAASWLIAGGFFAKLKDAVPFLRKD